MKIKFSEIRDTFLGWCIIHASTIKDKNINNIWPEIDAENLDVQFIVNNVELPIIQAFEDLREQDERRIKEAGLEYANEKLSKFWDVLNEIENKIHDELGIEKEY